MTQDSNVKLSKNERRQKAREQARIAREQERKREKRKRFIIQGSIVVGVLAVLAVVALFVVSSMQPAGPGPKNMASGGAVFTKDLQVVTGPALKDGETREAPEANYDELPVDVTVYADYMCPACGAFEQQYGTMLENYVGSGDVNLEVYPLTFLDPASNGSKYSTRAANTFGCLVEQQPEHAFALHNLLLSAEVQPTEGGTGLTDDQLIEQAVAAGVEETPELKRCVTGLQFGDFFQDNTKAATETGIQGLAEGEFLAADTTGETMQPEGPQRLISTPLVIVNGKQWIASRDGDLEQYLLKVKGELEQTNGVGNGDEASNADDPAASSDDAAGSSDDTAAVDVKPEEKSE